ncbi:helix-turn-helix domain-containing protein [Zhongshania sp.]|uniref:helix-turn-helix domain-containing protein n=1 Tax=Zhongshania sp. TaxID=1971902 RepID=UPI001B47C8B4|nr:helix-turn-helix domain-containing protein [Zhongshania sp.]MBQ0796240.1 helix-turn-helix domain-containing protein [Zhongshania sp.]
MIDAGSVFDRIALLLGTTTDKAIAEALGVSPQAITNSRKRGAVPYDKICAFAENNSASLDYLLLGIERVSSPNEILDSVRDEVNFQLIREIPSRFGPKTSPNFREGVQAFSFVYNQICHIDDKATRHTSIRKAIGMYQLQNQAEFEAIVSNSEEEGAGKDVVLESLGKGKQKIIDKYGLDKDSSTVSQVFESSVGQVAGRDVINPSQKGNK